MMHGMYRRVANRRSLLAITLALLLFAASGCAWVAYTLIDGGEAAFSHSIAVVKPNGGEVWHVGNLEEIQWEVRDAGSTVGIEYSTNSGTSWTAIITSTENDGAQLWTIPGDASEACRVRVTSTEYPATSDSSDEDFEIAPRSSDPYITVTAPNGREIWEAGTQQTVRWTGRDAGDFVSIQYSIDGGASWSTVTERTRNDGAAEWVPPNSSSSACLIRVTSVARPDAQDISNEMFEIAAGGVSGQIVVLSPNGGENWYSGDEHMIVWTSSDAGDHVRIDYVTTDYGSEWREIVAATPNDGSYLWLVSSYPGQHLVRISSTTQPDVFDTSDSFFWVNAGPGVAPFFEITVTSPNGGERWSSGTEQTIEWTSRNTDAPVRVDYSVDGGSLWTPISLSTPNDGRLVWVVPERVSTRCLIRVASTEDPADDCSDGLFEIWRPAVADPIRNPSFETAEDWINDYPDECRRIDTATGGRRGVAVTDGQAAFMIRTDTWHGLTPRSIYQDGVDLSGVDRLVFDWTACDEHVYGGGVVRVWFDDALLWESEIWEGTAEYDYQQHLDQSVDVSSVNHVGRLRLEAETSSDWIEVIFDNLRIE